MNIYSVLNSLHDGRVLAASIPAGNPDNYAWAGIYPLDLSRSTTINFLKKNKQIVTGKAQPIYHIRTFEVNRDLIDQDVSIAEQEMQNKISYFVFGDDELLQKLQELHIELEQLGLPYRSNYPI